MILAIWDIESQIQFSARRTEPSGNQYFAYTNMKLSGRPIVGADKSGSRES